MTKIQHSYTPQKLSFEYDDDSAKQYAAFVKANGGFNHSTCALTPLRLTTALMEDFNRTLHVFDSITAAIEAGVVDEDAWPEQLFADDVAFEVFLTTLEDYNEMHLVSERWYQAFFALNTTGEELDCVTSAGLAACLKESAEAL